MEKTGNKRKRKSVDGPSPVMKRSARLSASRQADEQKQSASNQQSADSLSTRKPFFNWTLEDRQRLFAAIRVYDLDDIEAIKKHVGTKTPTEIKQFLAVLRNRKYPDFRMQHSTAPIDAWLKSLKNVLLKDQDYSTVLSSVLSVAGELEPHHPPYSRPNDPDYGKLYQYLTDILHGDPAPDLSPIDSAIIVDLIQCVVDFLQQTDVQQERQMMIEKYRILTHKGWRREEVLRRLGLKTDSESDAKPTQGNVGETSKNQPSATVTSANANENSKESSAETDVSNQSSRASTPQPSTSDQDATETGESNSQNSGSQPNSATNMRTRSATKKAATPSQKLFTINPFCIDVRYLKLTRKLKKGVPKVPNIKGVPKSMNVKGVPKALKT